MRSVQVTAPGVASWVEVPEPSCGPRDVKLRMRAVGICGSDAMYTAVGGIPPRQGATPLGHEPAAEVVEIGAEVAETAGVRVGDHVVIDTMAFTDGLLGSGGAQGGLSEYVVVKDVVAGRQLKVVPAEVPWEVAALNEPMAVALHGVNRSRLRPGEKVVIFGAGPIGLGALLGFKSQGAGHVTVVDVQPGRLAKATAIGADAVIDSTQEDVITRLIELHGQAGPSFVRGVRPDSDVYYDAAGVPAVIATAQAAAKHGARLTIVAVHKKPVEFDLGALLSTELTLALSMGYPTEIFEVTEDLVANWEKYAQIISHRIPYHDALDALTLAATPGAADKVTVIFPDQQ